MDKYQKITVGFVVQDYITLSDGSTACISQNFIAGDEVSREVDGEVVEIDTTKEIYCPFQMEKPNHLPFPRKQ